jgi:hypothetical protein
MKWSVWARSSQKLTGRGRLTNRLRRQPGRKLPAEEIKMHEQRLRDTGLMPRATERT